MIIRTLEDLEQLVADGDVSWADADEVRTFMGFLGDAPSKEERDTPEGRAQLRAALVKHYPEQYPDLVAD